MSQNEIKVYGYYLSDLIDDASSDQIDDLFCSIDAAKRKSKSKEQIRYIINAFIDDPEMLLLTKAANKLSAANLNEHLQAIYALVTSADWQQEGF